MSMSSFAHLLRSSQPALCVQLGASLRIWAPLARALQSSVQNEAQVGDPFAVGPMALPVFLRDMAGIVRNPLLVDTASSRLACKPRAHHAASLPPGRHFAECLSLLISASKQISSFP